MTADCLVVIPARMASERFPGKPLADCGGKPVLRRTWEAVTDWPRAIDTYITSGDDEILDAAASWGAKTQPTKADYRHGSDRVLGALWRLQHKHDNRLPPAFSPGAASPSPLAFVVNVQGDEVGMTHGTLDAAVESLVKDWGAWIGTAAGPFAPDAARALPDNVKVVLGRTDRARYFSRWPLPGALHHVGLYVFRVLCLTDIRKRTQPCFLAEAERLEQLEWIDQGVPIAVARVESVPLAINRPGDLSGLSPVSAMA